MARRKISLPHKFDGKRNRLKKSCPACGALIHPRSALCRACRTATLAQQAIENSESRSFNGIPCRSIPLTKGYVAWVDMAWFEELRKFNWHASVDSHTVYAVRGLTVAERVARGKTVIAMHREIMGDPLGMLVDHRDGEGLHNWAANLRVATDEQNARNAARRKNNTSGFTGVSLHKRIGKYSATIQADGIQRFLGYFDSPQEAAQKYQYEAARLHADFATQHRQGGERNG